MTRDLPMDRADHDPPAPADRLARPSPRTLRRVLGLVWLLDGALQCQPAMFSKAFALSTLAGAGRGQPAWIAASVVGMARFLAPHIAGWNLLFAATQLAIGIGLVADLATRAALAASMGWSLAVWWLGEGFGGLFGAGASSLTGAPGAVLLYAVAAVLLWPRHGEAPDGTGSWAPRLAWTVFWLTGAGLQLLPANRAPGALRRAIVSGADGEPHLLAVVAGAAGRALRGHGVEVALALAAVEAAIGLGVLAAPPKAVLAVGIAVSVVFWVVGQDCGGIFTGSATDPNAAPLVVLLGLACWSAPNRPALRWRQARRLRRGREAFSQAAA